MQPLDESVGANAECGRDLPGQGGMAMSVARASGRRRLPIDGLWQQTAAPGTCFRSQCQWATLRR